MKKTALAVLVAFTSVSAHADETRWPKWYAALHGSVPFVAEKEISYGGGSLRNMSYDSGWGAGGSLGYMPTFGGGNGVAAWDSFRVEFEFHHQENDIDSIQSIAGLLQGNVSVDAYMGNIFYDMDMKNGFIPYIGAGAGSATIDFDSTTLGIKGTDTVLAYQGLAGVYYEPETMPLTRWGVGYRFLDSVNPKFGQGANTTEINYQSHSVEVGAQFRF
jgi:opacity protein-like surface antigen